MKRERGPTAHQFKLLLRLAMLRRAPMDALRYLLEEGELGGMKVSPLRADLLLAAFGHDIQHEIDRLRDKLADKGIDT